MSEKVIPLKRQLVNPDTPKLSEILKYRPYLDVVILEQRKTLTQLLTSCQIMPLLATAGHHSSKNDSRAMMLCRFCQVGTDDECHAMLYCVESSSPIERRGLLLRRSSVLPGVRNRALNLPPPKLLRCLIEEVLIAKLLVKYVFNVSIFF